MDAYTILFRIVHIASAILWFGSAVFYSAFVGPTLRAVGADGSRFFNHLVRQQKAVIFFLVVSTSTVVAGAFLTGGTQAGSVSAGCRQGSGQA